MNSRGWITVIVVLAIIILGLIYLLFTTPNRSSANPTPTTPSAQTAPASAQPLTTSSEAVVTSPTSNATVAHTFTVSGSAPNTWFSEAVFPIQVRDSDDDLIATAQAQAQGDSTKPGMIPFTAKITIDASDSGPATLIILKDNPSGDPENSDEVTVPIVVQ